MGTQVETELSSRSARHSALRNACYFIGVRLGPWDISFSFFYLIAELSGLQSSWKLHSSCFISIHGIVVGTVKVEHRAASPVSTTVLYCASKRQLCSVS